jgi:uncharacterized protein YfaA (DUF2138 family)
MRRGALARLVEPLARVALNDTQLRKVGDLWVSGSATAVYQLRYNPGRALLFATHGDRLLVLSSPDMLLEADERARFGEAETEILEDMLAGDLPFAQRFGLGVHTGTHRLSLGAGYLSFGYSRFFPALAGLRFDMTADGWAGFLALNPDQAATTPDTKLLDFRALWHAMPMGASACAAVPLSATALKPVLDRFVADNTLAPELAAQLGGPAALCWYAKSRLHTPLVVTRLQAADNAAVDAQLSEVFSALVGTYEANFEVDRFPVSAQSRGQAQTWQRVVGSHFGVYGADQADDPETLSARSFFRVSLARHGDTLAFSLDDRLVQDALTTLDKRFPPLAEQLPKEATVPLYLAPAGLAGLFEQETLTSLPADLEAVFRNAAQTHLVPKLRALAQHGRYGLTVPVDIAVDRDWTWVPVQWTELK